MFIKLRSEICIILFLVSFLFSNIAMGETASLALQQNDHQIIVFAGASNTNEIQWPNGSYFSKLQDMGAPWDNSTMINSSEDGWGVQNYYGNNTVVTEKISHFSPNYVFIVLGGNDLLRLLSPGDFEIQLNWLIDLILANDVEERIQMIFLANIYWVPLDLTGILLERFISYQNIIGNTSITRNLIELDYYQATLNRADFFFDPIHLNEEGQLSIAMTVNNHAGSNILINDKSFYDSEHTFVGSSITSPTMTSSSEEGMVSNDSTEDKSSLNIKFWIFAIPVYLMLRNRMIKKK